MDIFSHPHFFCPYCGTENFVVFDLSAGAKQQFVQDCETCCRPISVRVECTDGKDIHVSATPENE